MKHAIVGSRAYQTPEAIREFVAALPEGTIVVSGGAPGADNTGEQAHLARGGEVWSFRVRQLGKKEFGVEVWFLGGENPRIVPLTGEPTFANRKSALVYRDMLIAYECDEMSAFWNGWSPGTRFTTTFAQDIGKTVTWRHPRHEDPETVRHEREEDVRAGSEVAAQAQGG